MTAYLTTHPPVRDQWYAKRNRPLTGCTVLHTAESVMDTVGPDTGAEAVAEFIRTRTTAGSYHDLVDSDSWIPLVDLGHGAYHDGTGSNNWALSISFACATTDWRKMSPEKRRGFLRQGARAFANQQAYRRSIGAPLTELRLITKAQSDAGVSGFTYHGWRDPGRRSDPGVAMPNLFPIDEFIAECRAALAGTVAPTLEWDEMASKEEIKDAVREVLGEPRDRKGASADGKPLGGKTSFLAMVDWFDNAIQAIPSLVLGAKVKRQGEMSAAQWGPDSETSLGEVVAWSDENMLQLGTKIAKAVASGDPHAIAEAVAAAMPAAEAQKVAAQLVIVARS